MKRQRKVLELKKNDVMRLDSRRLEPKQLARVQGGMMFQQSGHCQGGPGGTDGDTGHA